MSVSCFIREATVADIHQMQLVRNTVRENKLSNPALVTNADCEEYITKKGKGWVCEILHRVTGFAIIDLQNHNVWALFVHPDYEKQGIGKKLHDRMLNWYFSKTTHDVWLGTAPGTRAESFYKKAGWKQNGLNGKNEIKFEMSYATWNS